MHYAHYGPEIGFCSCMAKYAWFKYPIVHEVTYGALGQARHFMENFAVDFMRGFVESHYDHHPSGGQVTHAGHDDYSADYSNSYNSYNNNNYNDNYNGYSKVSSEGYGPTRRRIGNEEDVYPEQNHRVIEKADPKLISVVEMLKNLKPKVNQNDSFIIQYARALNYHSQWMNGKSRDKIRKYPKKHHDDSTIKVTEVSAGTANSSSINATAEGRSMGSEYSNNRRVLVPGVPPGLPSFSDLPPADCKSYDLIYSHIPFDNIIK
jgi:hypothetical protein